MTSPGGSNLEMAGGVGVEVYPDTSRFGERLGAQILPDARKLGAELAKTISAGIAGAVAEAVTDGVRRSGIAARAQAARAGEAIGADMGRAIKARLDVAMRSLPDARIGVDLDNTDLAAVRAELAKLRDKTVTVTADVTAAYVDVAALREEIAAIPRRVTVKIDADTLDALAEIEALKMELAALRSGRNRPTPGPGPAPAGGGPGDSSRGYDEVDRAARRATSSVGALVAAGIMLGPAIIPVAAAAAAAIAGIGVAAAGVGAGLAVGVLGVSGIPAAVKALGEEQGKAAQYATDLATRQQSLADAEQALGNARAGAADASRRAAQQVRQADLGLADAQRQAARAQLQLNDARIAAKRALEDYQAQLAHLRLDEKAAQRDIEQAAANLLAAKQGLAPQDANGPSNQVSGGVRPDYVAPTIANPRAIEEAQYALDAAQLRLTDLQRQQQRASEDNAVAQAKGIEGSDQVVAAQERIRASLQAVQAAQEAATEARINAGSVARSNAQSIAAAERSLAEAHTGVTEAATASRKALDEAFKTLSPQAVTFTRFIVSLKDEMFALRREAEAGFLPGLQAGITALLPALPAMRDAVRAIATEMGNLARSAGEALAGPYWQDWFRFMTQQAVVALRTFGDIAGSTSRAVAGIVRAFAPLGQEFGVGLADLMERFATWANSLDENAGFAKLLDYIRTEGPVAAAVLGEIWTTLTHIIAAAAPIGSVVIRALGGVATVINALPIGVLTAVVTALMAIVATSKALAIWKTVTGGVFRDVAAVVTMSMGDARNAMRTAATQGAGAFSSAFTGIRAGASSAATGVGLLASSFGPQAALMIGITAVTIGMAYLFEQTQKKAAESKQRIDDLTNAFLGLAKAQDQGGNAATEYIKGQIETNKAFRDSVLMAEKFGVSVETLGGVTRGNKDDIRVVNESYDAYIKRLEKARDTFDTLAAGQASVNSDEVKEAVKVREEAEARFGMNLDKLLPKLKDNRQAMRVATAEYNNIARATGYATDENERNWQSLTKSSQDQITKVVPAMSALVQMQITLGDSASTAAQRTEALRQADESLFGTMRRALRSEEDAAEATERTKTAFDGMIRALDDMDPKQRAAAKSLDVHSEAGRNNRRVIEERYDALRREFLAEVENGTAVEEASRLFHEHAGKVDAAARAAGFDAEQLGRINTAFAQLPNDPQVRVTIDGVEKIMTDMQNVQIAQYALANHLSPEVATKQWLAREEAAFQQRAEQIDKVSHGRKYLDRDGTVKKAYADGGHVAGPGGPRDDVIPAWLSNGEYVVPAHVVNRFGVNFFDQMIGRVPGYPQVADGAYAPAFAAGGPVIGRVWPVPVALPDNLFSNIGFNPAGMSIANLMTRLGAGTEDMGVQTGPGGWQWQMQVLEEAFPGLKAISTYRPGDRVASGELSYHARARAVDLPPRMDIFNWIKSHFGARTKELIFTPAGPRQVWNGREHVFSPDVAQGHYDHVHWAYDQGGYLPPGATTVYNGTGKPEPVFTSDQWKTLEDMARRPAPSGGDTHYTTNVYPQRAELKLGDLLAVQARQEALSRVGRPR